MDLKTPILKLRETKVLRGHYPIIIKIPANYGHIVENKKGYYVITLTNDNNLRFYGLSSFFMKYQPKRDFEIKLNMFKHYAFMPIGKNLRQIMLINENDFLPVRFFAGIKTSYEGEANAAYLCKRFDELGILEVKKDYDTITK